MRGIGACLQRRSDQRFDLLIADHARAARPRLVQQPITTVLNKPVAPLRIVPSNSNRSPTRHSCHHRGGQHNRALNARPAALSADVSIPVTPHVHIVNTNLGGTRRRHNHPNKAGE